MRNLRRFLGNRGALTGLLVVAGLSLVALGASLLAPNEPSVLDLHATLLAPGAEPAYPLGTDDVGRCLLTRVMYGARVSLNVGLLTTAISMVIGVPAGMVSGFIGGRFDALFSRVVDIFLGLPEILLALALAAILGPGLKVVIVAISLVWWTEYARIVRGETLRLRSLEFVEAARSAGASTGRILWRHILPNVVGPVIVVGTLNFASAILVEASLSFLGLGVQPPRPSWGGMLSNARQYLMVAPWQMMVPGVCIALAVVGFNLLGDGLRGALDPRSRGGGVRY